jgi:O-antigen ligase
MAAMYGFAFVASVLVLDRPFEFEDWPFVYPIGGAAAVGVWRLSRAWSDETLQTIPRIPVSIVVALATWIAASSLWSTIPVLTVQRVVPTIGVLTFAMSFSLLPVRHQIIALALATNAATLLSAALITTQESVGRDGVTGDFVGIFANRNSLGPACAIALMTTTALIAGSRNRRTALIAASPLIVISVWLLAQSRSITPTIGLLATGVTIAIVAVCRRAHHELGWSVSRIRLVIAPTLVMLGIAAWMFSGLVLDAFGRDIGLSDRTSIWDDILDISRHHDWRGFGFWTFWSTEDVWSLYERHGWIQFGSAHNSFFEMLLGTGWVGALLFLALAASAAAGAFRASLTRHPGAYWWPALTCFLLAEHAMESFVLYHSYLLILLVGAAISPWLRSPSPSTSTIPTESAVPQ